MSPNYSLQPTAPLAARLSSAPLSAGRKMKAEEQYLDVLQNIEFGIVMT